MPTIGVYLKASGAVAAGVLVVVLAGTTLAKAGTTPGLLKATVNGTAQTPVGVLPHAFMELATYPDSMAGGHGPDGGSKPDWVSYGPTTNLSVPSHSLVTVTIKQYDTGGTITNPWFAKVHGTVDGTMTVKRKDRDAAEPGCHRTHVHHSRPAHEPGPVVRQRPVAGLARRSQTCSGLGLPGPG